MWEKKDFLLNLLEFVASYDTIDFKLPFLYFCYIFINSDLGPLSAATRVYFCIFCNLFVYWLWCPWFCILYSCIIFVLLTLMPLRCCRHRLFFLAAKIGMRWGNNEKKFFAKIKRNLFASVEKINRKMYRHFQVYNFYSVFCAFM